MLFSDSWMVSCSRLWSRLSNVLLSSTRDSSLVTTRWFTLALLFDICLCAWSGVALARVHSQLLQAVSGGEQLRHVGAPAHRAADFALHETTGQYTSQCTRRRPTTKIIFHKEKQTNKKKTVCNWVLFGTNERQINYDPSKHRINNSGCTDTNISTGYWYQSVILVIL